jgi:hypothetical protein
MIIVRIRTSITCFEVAVNDSNIVEFAKVLEDSSNVGIFQVFVSGIQMPKEAYGCNTMTKWFHGD